MRQRFEDEHLLVENKNLTFSCASLWVVELNYVEELEHADCWSKYLSKWAIRRKLTSGKFATRLWKRCGYRQTRRRCFTMMRHIYSEVSSNLSSIVLYKIFNNSLVGYAGKSRCVVSNCNILIWQSPNTKFIKDKMTISPVRHPGLDPAAAATHNSAQDPIKSNNEVGLIGSLPEVGPYTERTTNFERWHRNSRW